MRHVSPDARDKVLGALARIESLFYRLRQSDTAVAPSVVEELISATEGTARALVGLAEEGDLGNGISVGRIRKNLLITRESAIHLLEEGRPELWAKLSGMSLGVALRAVVMDKSKILTGHFPNEPESDPSGLLGESR